MKRMLVILSGLGLLTSLGLAGEATAISIATNGGHASATATAAGNARSLAVAGATRGGVAVANSDARGWGGGFADGRAVAIADRGLALSNAKADARGLLGGRSLADLSLIHI